jgi:hypothetical protein
MADMDVSGPARNMLRDIRGNADEAETEGRLEDSLAVNAS